LFLTEGVTLPISTSNNKAHTSSISQGSSMTVTVFSMDSTWLGDHALIIADHLVVALVAKV
jgi:hypothetical protein